MVENARIAGMQGRLTIITPTKTLSEPPAMECWKGTGLSWNASDGVTGPGVYRNGNLHYTPEAVSELGYPVEGLSELMILSAAARDVHEDLIANGGVGITGFDILMDELDLYPLEVPFPNALRERGLVYVGILPYRKSTVAVEMRGDDGIGSYDEFRGYLEKAKRDRRTLRVLTTYPNLTRSLLASFDYAEGVDFELVESEGQTEKRLAAGLAEFAVEVMETGKAVFEAGLRAIDPPIIPCSTPVVAANAETYETFQKFIDELYRRSVRGIAEVKERAGHYFVDRLNPAVYDDPETRTQIQADYPRVLSPDQMGEQAKSVLRVPRRAVAPRGRRITTAYDPRAAAAGGN